MSKITFVFEYEEGKAPVVHAGITLEGGKLCAVQFGDALEELGMLEEIREQTEYPDSSVYDE